MHGRSFDAKAFPCHVPHDKSIIAVKKGCLMRARLVRGAVSFLGQSSWYASLMLNDGLGSHPTTVGQRPFHCFCENCIELLCTLGQPHEGT